MLIYPPLIPVDRVSELQPVAGVVTNIEGAVRGADGLWRGAIGGYTYTVQINLGFQTITIERQINPFNIWPDGYAMICHTVGKPVVGTRLGEFYYLQFVENRDEGECPE